MKKRIKENETEKTGLGFTFYYLKGNGNGFVPEYAHPTFRFYSIHDYKYSKEWRRSDTEILEITSQTDREKGHSIFKSYALSANHAEITDQTVKILNTIVKNDKGHWNPSRKVVRAIKALKAERLVYDDVSHMHIPYAFRKNSELWTNAFKQGLKINK